MEAIELSAIVVSTVIYNYLMWALKLDAQRDVYAPILFHYQGCFNNIFIFHAFLNLTENSLVVCRTKGWVYYSQTIYQKIIASSDQEKVSQIYKSVWSLSWIVDVGTPHAPHVSNNTTCQVDN